MLKIVITSEALWDLLKDILLFGYGMTLGIMLEMYWEEKR